MIDELAIVSGSHLRGSSGFRGIAGESKLRPRIVPQSCKSRYFMRCRDDGYVSEVVLYNPDFSKSVTISQNGIEVDCGPAVVFTVGPDGEHHRWGCRHERDDELTFYPHPGYVHTLSCKVCAGNGVVGIDPVTNPMGSVCRDCEGSGAVPNTPRLVTPHDPECLRGYGCKCGPERIYLEPVKMFSFAPILSGA